MSVTFHLINLTPDHQALPPAPHPRSPEPTLTPSPSSYNAHTCYSSSGTHAYFAHTHYWSYTYSAQRSCSSARPPALARRPSKHTRLPRTGSKLPPGRADTLRSRRWSPAEALRCRCRAAGCSGSRRSLRGGSPQPWRRRRTRRGRRPRRRLG